MVQSSARQSSATGSLRRGHKIPATLLDSNKSQTPYRSTGNVSRSSCRFRLFEMCGAVMISRHNHVLFEPFDAWSEIAVRPSGVKGNENQVRHDDRLRKSKHQRSDDECAHQCVVDKVGARSRDPIQRFRRMVNGMKTPQERYLVKSQMNKIFSNVGNHHRQEKL